MKKYLRILAALSIFILLTACHTSKKQTKPTSNLTQATEQTRQNSTAKSSAEQATSNSSSTPSSASDVTKTTKGVNSDLGQARIALYQAGINSASISDTHLLQYWNDAKATHTDFVTYIKEKFPDLAK